MSGRPTISAYTPSNTDPELLKRIFVQREKLLEQIVGRLSRSMTTGDKHHILLVGPRGSGKTHLVSLAVWELQQNEELTQSMRIAWLGEDDSFTGLIHLAFGIASQLAQEYPDEFPGDFKAPVRGLPPDDAALAVLHSLVEQLGDHNLLLVTENMDQTFRSLGDSGQKKWRAFLQETRKIATLATAQQLFAGVSDRKEAFFGFFDIQHMEPLSVDEASELIARISIEQSKPSLANYLQSHEGRFRIRALHYLAGGNHRMYVLLAEFLTKDSLQDLVAAFESLAHDMTPYFQERVWSLPDQQKQLVQCLCDAGGALTVKEIAGETFIEERTCSKQLGNLKAKGYVRSEKRGKESYYDMAEPLMRLCLEIKNQRGRPLRLVARFLRAWFPTTTLERGSSGKEDGRVGEYCAVALKSGNTFESAIANDLMSEIESNIKGGELDAARNLTRELQFADETLARASQFRLAELDERQGNFESSIKSLTTLIETTDSAEEQASALLVRGRAYGRQDEFALASEDFSAVINMCEAPVKQRAEALYNRGVTFGKQGQIKRALADYSAVIEMRGASSEINAFAHSNRGLAYGQQGDVERALADFSEVIAMDKASAGQRARALRNRAFAFGKQGDVERKLADYSAVIEMADAPSDQKAAALVSRGLTYAQQGEVERELADYSAVIEMADAPADQKAKALLNRGLTYAQQSEVEQELADYSALIEMDDAPSRQKTMSLVNRGITYGQRGEIERALADYSAVIEMDDAPADQKAKALLNRGITYGQQGDVERELADYSAVIKMDDASADQKANALLYRGLTYAQQGEVEQELADYSAVIEMDDAPADQKAKALLNRGITYGQQGAVERKLADYSAVIKMD
ncbi:MAG: tetratricopeptide repeat protein, partial [Planctomycetota bacterium]